MTPAPARTKKQDKRPVVARRADIAAESGCAPLSSAVSPNPAEVAVGLAGVNSSSHLSFRESSSPIVLVTDISRQENPSSDGSTMTVVVVVSLVVIGTVRVTVDV